MCGVLNFGNPTPGRASWPSGQNRKLADDAPHDASMALACAAGVATAPATASAAVNVMGSRIVLPRPVHDRLVGQALELGLFPGLADVAVDRVARAALDPGDRRRCAAAARAGAPGVLAVPAGGEREVAGRRVGR